MFLLYKDGNEKNVTANNGLDDRGKRGFTGDKSPALKKNGGGGGG